MHSRACPRSAHHADQAFGLQDAESLAQAIAAQSRHSVFAYKKLYQEQADLPLNAGLAHEVFNSSGVGADFAERVAGKFG